MSCTTILIGKHASWDGSTIIARDDDSGSGRYDPKRLVVVHPADQPRHYTSTLSHVEIDLPDDPCRYMIAPNVLPNRGVLAEAGVNVHNVCMTATETIAVNERVLAADPMVEPRPATGTPGDADYAPETPGGIGEEDIITLVLPYVSTARDGVLRLGGLLERYGTYEANGIAISDADEIWYVETIGGHHWIARRVPDDCYATIPNQLGIDDFDLDDAFGERRDFMCSADLREFMARHHLDMTMRPAGRGAAIGFGAATGGTNGNANGGATASARTAHGTPNAHCAVGTTATDTTAPAAGTATDTTDAVIVAITDATATSTNSTATGAMPLHRFNPRHAFGTSTPKDHIYNTPRAWYMQRHLNPSDDWDSPAARWTPTSDDIPWCRAPERRVSIEDVEFLLASHFEGTPFDPYGTLGTPESRHRYRPIGINRTGHMVAMQVRPDVPAANRALMWVSFGSGPFTAAAPFYANATDAPAYLRDTPAEPSTDSLYWTNRIIAAMADPHYIENSNAIEQYREAVHAFGHRHVFETDEALAQTVGNASVSAADAPLGAATLGNATDDSNASASSTIPTDNSTPVDNNTPTASDTPTSDVPTNNDAEHALDAAATQLTRANEETGDFLRRRTTRLLADVLYTSSNLMRNSFAMSDRWA